MSYLLASDTLHGASGKAFVTIDGKVCELFGAKNISTNMNLSAAEMKVVGTKKAQEKPGAAKLTGKMTVYYGTPLFLDMAAQYIRTGTMPSFALQVANDDEAAAIGAQTVAYYGCRLSGDVPLSLLDAEADMLTMELSFSFEDFEVLSAFHDPENLGV